MKCFLFIFQVSVVAGIGLLWATARPNSDLLTCVEVGYPHRSGTQNIIVAAKIACSPARELDTTIHTICIGMNVDVTRPPIFFSLCVSFIFGELPSSAK